ncbi:MAG: hypothetical protein PHC61_00285, partial [Chitinivibrionales bacterium]|nr:hypothetical protein [Chitinivibrionales bacterium]
VNSAPAGYSFVNRIFIWKPAANDTGTHNIIFVAINKKDLRLTDTQTVAVLVSSQFLLPAKPLNFRASERNGKILTLNWSAVAGADSFLLYRNIKRDSAGYARIKTIFDTTCFDTVPVVTGAYFYYLIAKNRAGVSGSSDTVAFTDALLTVPTTSVSILDTIKSINVLIKLYSDSNKVLAVPAGRYDKGTIQLLGKVFFIDNIH